MSKHNYYLCIKEPPSPEGLKFKMLGEIVDSIEPLPIKYFIPAPVIKQIVSLVDKPDTCFTKDKIYDVLIDARDIRYRDSDIELTTVYFCVNDNGELRSIRIEDTKPLI